ncbi:MAG: dockerin type I domain-containing protein [Candidatus Hydrogenedentes bacterium]|nr:dockerin type I domain-containing protein [Candidatus Hydrogenedentota bacterium]
MKRLLTSKLRCQVTSILGLLLLAFPFANMAFSVPISGDVNADGKIDILDIQQGINIAIGVSEFSQVADVNDSHGVDVLDVQILINTVLGTGGLVQNVIGAVNVSSEQIREGLIKIVALSEDGRILLETLSSTGGFRLLLPVGVSWSIGALVEVEDKYFVFPLNFPVLGQNNLSLPLKDISLGHELDLGTIDVNLGSVTRVSDLRHLLGSIAEKLPSADEDGNNLPDIYDNFFDLWKRSFQSNVYLQYLALNEDIFQQFLRDVGNCVAPYLEVILTPSLNLFETEGFPEMLIPVVQCIRNVCVNYLKQLGIPNAESIVDTLFSQIASSVEENIEEWLNSLGVPEITDLNGNRVPDFIEDSICLGNSSCEFDSDSNGIPDFLDDADSDGIPNFLDRDSSTESDTDGDGIPNELDLDANGNGVLDYAENPSK